MATALTPLATDDFWSKNDQIDDYLAKKLRTGSSSLVLGAGASHGFNLPNWEQLVEAMCLQCGAAVPAKPMKSEEEADKLLIEHYGGDRLRFASAVRTALYENAKNEASFLLKSELLQALSAFLANSVRGKAGTIVTFNFDDILETYLKLLGFVVRSETAAPAWTSNADMHVFHPHGLLPIESETGMTRVVFTASDFDAVVGNAQEAWNQVMKAIWSGTFPVFIGLSGDDQRLRTLLQAVKANHPATISDGSLYWGVRPTPKNESSYKIQRWRSMGIAPRIIDSYADLPGWILSVCQRAARLHA